MIYAAHYRHDRKPRAKPVDRSKQTPQRMPVDRGGANAETSATRYLSFDFQLVLSIGGSTPFERRHRGNEDEPGDAVDARVLEKATRAVDVHRLGFLSARAKIIGAVDEHIGAAQNARGKLSRKLERDLRDR